MNMFHSVPGVPRAKMERFAVFSLRVKIFLFPTQSSPF